jgi:putative membrane protein
MDGAPAKARTSGDTARDHLANERTMLAWCRTSVAVMALGFVVARFGLFLRELGRAVPQRIQPGVSTAFGTALVVAGGMLVILATLRYLQTSHAIDRHAYQWSPALALVMSMLLILVAAALAAYLLLTG